MDQKGVGCLKTFLLFPVKNIFAMLINQECEKVHKFKSFLLKKHDN